MSPIEMQDAILFQHHIIYAASAIAAVCLIIVLAVLLVPGDG